MESVSNTEEEIKTKGSPITLKSLKNVQTLPNNKHEAEDDEVVACEVTFEDAPSRENLSENTAKFDSGKIEAIEEIEEQKSIKTESEGKSNSTSDKIKAKLINFFKAEEEGEESVSDSDQIEILSLGVSDE